MSQALEEQRPTPIASSVAQSTTVSSTTDQHRPLPPRPRGADAYPPPTVPSLSESATEARTEEKKKLGRLLKRPTGVRIRRERGEVEGKDEFVLVEDELANVDDARGTVPVSQPPGSSNPTQPPPATAPSPSQPADFNQEIEQAFHSEPPPSSSSTPSTVTGWFGQVTAAVSNLVAPPLSSSTNQLDQPSSTSDAQQQEIEALRKTLDAMDRYARQELADAHQHEKEARVRYSNLQQEMQFTQSKLEEAQKELIASRAFVEMHDKDDISSVVTGIESLNEAVDDFIFQSLSSNGLKLDSMVLNSTTVAEVKESARPDFAPLVETLAKHRRTAFDVLSLRFAQLIFAGIMETVFNAWSGEEDADSVIEALYQRVCETEPQERSSRWRSITFLRCTSPIAPDSLASKLALHCFANLISLVPSATSLELTKPWTALLTPIVSSAIKWRHKTRVSHLSANFEPTLARSSESRVVLAPTGFGLREDKSVSDGKGGIRVVGKVLVKEAATCKDDL